MGFAYEKKGEKRSRIIIIIKKNGFGCEKERADARKRYTAMVPRHKGVHMNTP